MPRVLLIVNPRAGAGNGRRSAERAAAELERAGRSVERRVTQRPGHAREIAAALEPSSCEAVGVVGGDGTVHEVANGLAAPSSGAPPLALLPAGSGDSLARDLGIGDALAGARAILAGKTRALDVAHVEVDGERLLSLNLFGWGAVARIAHGAERLRCARRLRYDLAALRELARPRLPRGEARFAGAAHDSELLGGAVCLTRFVGRGLELAPPARLDDGALDLVLLRGASRLELAALFLALKRGRHLEHPCVEHRRIERLELALPPGSPIVIDGEPRRATRISLEVLPEALTVFAPPERGTART